MTNQESQELNNNMIHQNKENNNINYNINKNNYINNNMNQINQNKQILVINNVPDLNQKLQ